MKNIFIDTSIFRKENYLDGSRIKEFLRLCKEWHFQLVLPLITINEIKAQYKKAVAEAKRMHNEVINSRALDVLKNSPSCSEVSRKFDKEEVLLNEFNLLLDKALEEAHVIILPYPTSFDLSEILDSYFKNKFPFNRGEKKHEFPDAFAIKQLEDWCEENKTTCVVFSNDKDFLKTKSKFLEIKSDYDNFIALYLAEIETKRMTTLALIMAGNQKVIEKLIGDWFWDRLNNEDIYYTDGYDIHDIEIKDVIIEESDYQVVGMSKKSIEVEIEASVRVKVEIEVDDENSGIWDSEDKYMIYTDTTIATVDETVEIVLKGSVFIDETGDCDETVEITEINEGKELSVCQFIPDLFEAY